MPQFSSGLPKLDTVLESIMAGDNVVWQIDRLEDYFALARPFYTHAVKTGRKLIYFRFAQHEPVIPENEEGVERIELDPQMGFEQFISKILTAVKERGEEAHYVFDVLSDLSVDWYSDRMLGNFFMLTCPYLYIFDTITYFGLLRNHHTPLAANAIHQTAQVVLDVYNSEDRRYILPLKVWKRYSETMYMLHSWEGVNFAPVMRSTVISQILGSIPQPWLDGNFKQKDTWIRIFNRAEQVHEDTTDEKRENQEVKELKMQLMKMVISREHDDLRQLCDKYFTLEDLILIGKRMIGTGLIGGKSVGMLLARAILKKKDPKWVARLETHDSFYIGSDVFYTYVVVNDCWWQRHQLKTTEDPATAARQLQAKLENGEFPEDIIEQFKEMLNYFGQSPIIVRSSSLLEDAYGNSFSGKYESVFCVNQGTPEDRLSQFMDAVRTVYASTMSKRALTYRMHKGLLHRDEQMALLVQRVSGEFFGKFYFPHIAGVGYSHNPFVWNEKIDPKKGVLRLVFGLGTRAVDRHDDDYTRVVALNAPMLTPEMTFEGTQKYAQRVVDILDMKRNAIASTEFEAVAEGAKGLPLHLFASKDREIEKRASQMNLQNVFSWVLKFEDLLTKTEFVIEMKEMLRTLDQAYNHPVDIEFAANFLENDEYRINLLQCRPFQFKGGISGVKPCEGIADDKVVLKTAGPILGQSLIADIDRLIYIVPSRYGVMSMSDRYAVARLVGEITNATDTDKIILLAGPGRWGTKMPALGIPVAFSEIKNVSVLCELVIMHEGLTPDISLGTHFFNDLVEMGIVYMGIFPEREVL